MTEDFKDHPRSIAEVRSSKTQRATDWTPRDVLVSLLRDIDSGKRKLEAVVVSYKEVEDGKDGERLGWAASSPGITTSLGLLNYAASCIMRDTAP